LRLFSFGGYGLALAALALGVFGAIEFPPIFSVQYYQNKKKISPSENPKFNYLGIFQCLKLRNSMGKIVGISLKLNFTPNTLCCYG